MNALSPSPASLASHDDAAPPHRDEPVSLLQLTVGDAAEAASAVYRQVRLGRRVVAVACGRPDAAHRLIAALDAIGMAAHQPSPGDALLGDGVAVVDGPATTPAPAVRSATPVRVALAGRGVVGGGVLARLLADPRLEVVGVLVRDAGRSRDVDVPAGLVVTDPAALLAREPDILIEAISDASTGLALIRAALSRGVDVVSANKQAIGADLPGLVALAGSSGARLAYSACVGGGAPMIETVRRARAHGPVVRIEAVLNGTCNYILNRLSQGHDFTAALSAARSAGFAEADPSADLTGLDAAAKLAILAYEGLGESRAAGAIARQSLTPGGVLPRGRVRQLARLDVAGGQAGVRILPMDDDPLFADLPDEWNALRVTTADGRVFTARGRGAGRAPTAESVWADLRELAGFEG